MMRSDILFSNRLAARLFGYFLLLALAPIQAFGYFANWQTSRQMEETHEHYLLKTAVMFNQLFLNLYWWDVQNMVMVLSGRARLVELCQLLGIGVPEDVK